MTATGGNEQTGSANISDSLIRIELITCFHCHPGLEGTCSELAERIGRDASRVEGQMKKLVQLKILEELPLEGETRYRYLPPHSLSLARKTSCEPCS